MQGGTLSFCIVGIIILCLNLCHGVHQGWKTNQSGLRCSSCMCKAISVATLHHANFSPAAQTRRTLRWVISTQRSLAATRWPTWRRLTAQHTHQWQCIYANSRHLCTSTPIWPSPNHIHPAGCCGPPCRNTALNREAALFHATHTCGWSSKENNKYKIIYWKTNGTGHGSV